MVEKIHLSSTFNRPVQWLTVLIKFNIWKIYASHTYGQGKVNPDWFKSALKEWLDLGFDTKEKAKEKRRELKYRNGPVMATCIIFVNRDLGLVCLGNPSRFHP